MDIEGLGERTVYLFCKEGLLADVADIYSLDFERVQGFEGFGTLSVANLGAAITELQVPASGQPARRAIGQAPRREHEPAPGPGDGPPRQDNDAPEDEVAGIEGIGPVIAASITRFFPCRATVRSSTACGSRPQF